MSTKTKKRKANKAVAPPVPAGPRYYKVLDTNGRSFHGGNMQYSLPTGDKPGDWHEVKGELSMCNRGLHLTNDPVAWWANGATCYEVEYDAKDVISDGGNKIAVRRARLIRRLTESDLAAIGIFTGNGEYEWKNGNAWAYDSATVTASSSATVTAYGSATVQTYYGNPSVQLAHYAVLIDRRAGEPKVSKASDAAVATGGAK